MPARREARAAAQERRGVLMGTSALSSFSRFAANLLLKLLKALMPPGHRLLKLLKL